MSGAILGIINLKENIENDYKKMAINSMKRYKLDKIDTLQRENIFMACGIINVTKENTLEQLPRLDYESELIITADAIIDNREELEDLLNIENENLSDSDYILKSYKKWGEKCVDYLVGDFSFAIWDFNNKKLFLTTDHCGTRCLYYIKDDEKIIFSTTLDMILDFTYNRPNLREEWILKYIGLRGGIGEIDLEETIYEDIKYLPASHFLKLKEGNLSLTRYWNPQNTIKEEKLNDNEYVTMFKESFIRSVKDKIRTNKNVGAYLSGGMDSGSVVCVASEFLDNINTYSSIPLKEFGKRVLNGRLIDETEFILEIKEKYPNVKLNFIDSKGRDSVNVIDEWIDIIEYPYKTIENSIWINNLLKYARKDGCKLMLSGQFGNATISNGNIGLYFFELLNKRKYFKFIKSTRNYSKSTGLNKYKLIKNIIKSKFNKEEKICSILNENLEYKVIEDLKVFYNKCNINSFTSIKDITDLLAFKQIGVIYTKLSLNEGIIVRDPTIDKRLIECFYKIPTKQFVYNDMDRAMIVRCMDKILPDKIRLNKRVKALQSGDFKYRLDLKKDDILKEFNDSKINTNKYYVKNLKVDYEKDFREIIIPNLILNRFINKYNNKGVKKYEKRMD